MGGRESVRWIGSCKSPWNRVMSFAGLGALEMDIERIEYTRHFGQQLVVIVDPGAGAGKHGFEPACLRGRFAADIQAMHHFADAYERCVSLERERRQKHFERHLVVDVREGRTVKVEAQRVFGNATDVAEPDEGGILVDEATNQPGAGDAVHPGPATCRPTPALVVTAREALNRAMGGQRFIGAVVARETRLRVRRGALCPFATFAGEVVDREDRFQAFVPEPKLTACFRFRALAQTLEQRIKFGLAFPVSLSAIKQAEPLVLELRVLLCEFDDIGGCPGCRQLTAQFVERLPQFAALWQQIDAVAEDGRAERFHLPPEAHPQSAVLAGQRGDKEQPGHCVQYLMRYAISIARMKSKSSPKLARTPGLTMPNAYLRACGRSGFSVPES